MMLRTGTADMPKITIYTKSSCPYCHDAKVLLRAKNAVFEEISVDGDYASQVKMAQRAQGRSSVPQIFIGEAHVGGCDDLYALDKAGKLDPLLAA